MQLSKMLAEFQIYVDKNRIHLTRFKIMEQFGILIIFQTPFKIINNNEIDSFFLNNPVLYSYQRR